MPLSPTSEKTNQTLVLRKETVSQMRKIAEDESTRDHQVGLSNLAQRLIDLGLDRYLHFGIVEPNDPERVAP